jgi:hypothetical protein
MIKYLAIIPVVHIANCYAYLYFIYFGFGANVASQSSIDNIFAVSLGSILPAYLFAGVMYAIGHLINVESPLQVAGRESFGLHPTMKTKFADLPFKLLPWLFTLILICDYVINNTINVVFIAVATIGIYSKYTAEFAARNGLDLRIFSVVSFSVFATMILFAMGYVQGFSLRHDNFEHFSGEYAMCDEKLLLFPVGENFISVGKDNHKSIIGSDCKIIYDLPKSSVKTWVR